jgi:hypothetical protein
VCQNILVGDEASPRRTPDSRPPKSAYLLAALKLPAGRLIGFTGLFVLVAVPLPAQFIRTSALQNRLHRMGISLMTRVLVDLGRQLLQVDERGLLPRPVDRIVGGYFVIDGTF